MDKNADKKSDLPNTPRVSDKILEYYLKYGQSSNLEKFMRLYSPVSSQDSEKAQSDDACSALNSNYKRTTSRENNSSSSSEPFAMMTSQPFHVCPVANSKSLPNMDVEEHPKSAKGYFSSTDVIVDINIVAEGEKEKLHCKATENFITPKKALKNIKTQTPESIAKTHRRLEWDSLGDIGYKKSISTSNISTIERSFLKEFFKESSVVSEPENPISASVEHNTDEQRTVKNRRATEMAHSTPPLACSTFVSATNKTEKPNMMSQYTSTSLNQKFDKYAQTSVIKRNTVRSQEIQCSISSSKSIIDSTVTPSSFEYYSSKSSKSSKSSDVLANADSQKQLNPLDNPFIATITDLLMKRKTLSEKNHQKSHHNIHQLQTKFESALNENKENYATSTLTSTSTAASLSLSKKAPELDLGVQLICSLIDAKSINGRQKKQLVRDIIKRITCFEGDDKTSTSSTVNSAKETTANSSDYQPLADSTRPNNKNIHKQNSNTKLSKTSKLIESSINTEIVKTQEKSLISNTTSIKDNLSSVNVTKNPVNLPASNYFPTLQEKSVHTNVQKEKFKKRVSNAAAFAINNATQSDLIMMDGSENKNKPASANCKLAANALDKKNLKTSAENKINRCTQTSKTSLSSTSATTTPDLITQKFIAAANNELNNTLNTDAEQPTMREWLNPLTHSEIEYEERKKLEMRKKAEAPQENLVKKSKHDCGRLQQLNWIEKEMKRLECLRHLLLKDETTTTTKSSTSISSSDHIAHKKFNNDSTRTDKLYDSVYSDKSSGFVQEIEITLEESHEDLVNIKNNTKCTKDRKKETKIVYEKEEDTLNKGEKIAKPKFCIINENINYHQEQLLNRQKDEKQQQREKIDTPSTNKSNECESLKDLVQQRKREFMKAYKTKKQHHYEALKQQPQQKYNFKYLNMPPKYDDKAIIDSDSEHYSVPQTLPRNYILLSTSSEKEKHIDGADVHKTTATTGLLKTAQQNSHKVIKTTSVNNNNNKYNNTTTSSSSMLCVSSDISVPQGSQNTSSTPTTTHQYDDVAIVSNAIGVAVQTSDSIRRFRPVHKPTQSLPYAITTFTTTACIQVKPKGIAYVIEFEDSKTTVTSTNSDIDTKSNAKSNQYSNNAQVINKFKPAISCERPMTLQEHLEKARPTFLQHSKERKAILNQLQTMRQERDRQLREIIDNTSFNSLDRRLYHLPPPPIQKVRILNTKEMKALTNKRFTNLPEVIAKQERETEEKNRRTNRILKHVFNKRLQKRVRDGKLSLNHSKTVI